MKQNKNCKVKVLQEISEMRVSNLKNEHSFFPYHETADKESVDFVVKLFGQWNA